jgi:C-terminal processing protease CtpA/Prc
MNELVGLIPGHDPQIYSQEALAYLRKTESIMTLIGKPYNGKALLELESVDGSKTRVVTMLCTQPVPQSKVVLPVHSEILKGPIGYLAFRSRMFPGEDFKNEIVNAMNGLQQTKGMILDLRGNLGGARDCISLLLRYFIPPGERPVIINVASVRMDVKERPEANAELLRSRMLWSEDWQGWKADEKMLVKKAAKNFKPSLNLARQEFGGFHFMVVPGGMEPDVYYYQNKVIVLHDDKTASAAGLLLSALKGRKNVLLMGYQSNSDSGFPQAYQLPNSKIIYWLSSMASFNPDGSLLDRIEPDIPFQLTMDDLNQMINYGVDPLRDQALKILQNEINLPGH